MYSPNFEEWHHLNERKVIELFSLFNCRPLTASSVTLGIFHSSLGFGQGKYYAAYPAWLHLPAVHEQTVRKFTYDDKLIFAYFYSRLSCFSSCRRGKMVAPEKAAFN